ncbi:oxidoreductase domain containing [Cordyceps militaris]|uniref:Putative gamma-glutamylcyclotransferase n=1 Tax=Cordyceps militaris TaxID=73501 RepID=A0A2H4SK66_CORMI|nr:oxidoreductase domain containing [Cordyceps militaris]
MDLLSACESLASNVLEFNATSASDLQISDADIEHWRCLFKLTRAEAIEEISNWRLDFGRDSLSQSAWDLIKDSDFASGFSKESYEFSLAHGRKFERGNATKTDDNGIVHFRPSFIRVSIAMKKLSDISRYLTLGIESTLPQYRAETSTECFRPAQNEYPVPYFFYGTLADRAVLARVIGVSDEGSIEYESAMVSGAALSTWANKYLGLVNSFQHDQVEGKVYWVKSREEEEALRIYETAKYEVVRCEIHLDSGINTCMGLTFRLC